MEQKLCVLIDFENVAAGTEKEGMGRFDIRRVMRRLKDKGRILVSRAYGDWGRFARFKQGMLEQGITMAELTSYRGAEKNRADIALVVDAMELAFTRPYIETFVLLSGDSDFTPLVMRLKELNKRVIGMGTRGSTSRLLVDCCDEFIFYRSLKGGASDKPSRSNGQNNNNNSSNADEGNAPPSRDAAFALLVETLNGIQKDGPGPVLAGLVKQSMQRKEPAFDEAEYDYSTFARFLEAAQDKGLVRVFRDKKAGGYRVDQPGSTNLIETEAEPEEEVPESPELDGEAGRLQSILARQGMDPSTQLLRHTVVHELVDHVAERVRRKRRNTLMYVYGDISRRCRKTDPYVPKPVVRSVITTLRNAGEIRHADGDPVRSNTAAFVLTKDAEELLGVLRNWYVQTLLQAGEALSDPKALSTLLWGDSEHSVAAEELVAWAQHHIQNLDSTDEPSKSEEVAADTDVDKANESANTTEESDSKASNIESAPPAEPEATPTETSTEGES